MTRRQSNITSGLILVILAALLMWGWYHRGATDVFVVITGIVFLFLLFLIFASGEATSPWKEKEAEDKKAFKKASRQAIRNADADKSDWGNKPHIQKGGFFN